MKDLLSILEEELASLKTKNLFRRIRTVERSGPVTAAIDGREILLFCGNDYLGLSFHPRVIRAAKEATERWGAGSGAARLVAGASPLHVALEETLAAWKKKEKALLFSAGYLANTGALGALANEKDLIVMDKLCHASLIDGARMSGATIRVFPHKNYERLREILEKSSEGFRRKIIVSDSVFSMDGDSADLKILAAIKKQYDGFLIVDDAHGTGVLGLTGKGAAEDLNLEAEIDVFTGTLSKALGTLGGFVAASDSIIQYLINFSRPFIFATALPPAVCASALEAMRVIEEDATVRYALWRNIQTVHEGLSDLGFEVEPIASPIFPIILEEEDRALAFSRFLLEHGIFIPAIRPPTVPKGKARLRLTVSAAHRPDDIRNLLDVFKLASSKVLRNNIPQRETP